ncbi:MAG TPA: subclass B3 metallo-beta-lactamase [Polyangiaceae bacterium]|nr:subclass B3 metallo-beta-lactamase [Polyangiaceae bacterium]
MSNRAVLRALTLASSLAALVAASPGVARADGPAPAPLPPAKGIVEKTPPLPPAPGTPAAAMSRRQVWNQPFAPFHVLGNIHYVGAGVSSFLITTPDGAILLDGGLPETAPMIEKSIAQQGFRIRDVKVLINSHAHYDHAGGLAALKKASGAKLVASRGDAPALRLGNPDQPAVGVDRVIDDGDTVELGGTVLTAHVTPGHTPGCTTWTTTVTDAGKPYKVVFYCSTSVVDRLVGNTQYPNIVADYEHSFPILRALPADVFLANHAEFFDLAGKRERMKTGGPNPFIDPGELRRFVDDSEKKFREVLQREQSEQQKSGGAASKPPAAP